MLRRNHSRTVRYLNKSSLFHQLIFRTIPSFRVGLWLQVNQSHYISACLVPDLAYYVNQASTPRVSPHIPVVEVGLQF